MLTIIMYHYVRDLRSSRYPRINGLDNKVFDNQLDSILKNYTVCDIDQVIAAATGEARLPQRACLLTFDDGFIDHYLTVFPKLNDRGIAGSFYPAVEPIREQKVLDVHKIHFIVAASEDYQKLTKRLFSLLSSYRSNHPIPDDSELLETYAKPGRLDPPEVMLIKGVLQRGLPENIRTLILDQLFSEWVSADEDSFARELYMNMDMLRSIATNGMTIGGHGAKHVPLQTLTEGEQAEEINQTVEFLGEVTAKPPNNWVMCYPWGTYNDTTISLLKNANCALALAYGGKDTSDLSKPFELTRLDATNFHQ